MNIVDTILLKYGLYFERFIDVGALQLLKEKLTKAQLKLPDFDIDFGTVTEKKFLNLLVNRYGKDRVVSLGSFQYMGGRKGAIKGYRKVPSIFPLK